MIKERRISRVLVHVHVPVHDVPFADRVPSLKFLMIKPHRFLVYGNVNRFAVNVYGSKPWLFSSPCEQRGMALFLFVPGDLEVPAQ
jgi:hypothetical protein